MRRLCAQPYNDQVQSRNHHVTADLRQLLVDVLTQHAVLLAEVPNLKEAVFAAGQQQLAATALHRVDLSDMVFMSHQLEQCLISQQVVNDYVGILRTREHLNALSVKADASHG